MLSFPTQILVAIISIWLWTEDKHFFKQTIVSTGIDEADSSYKWLINLAIEMTLSALANFFDSHRSRKKNGKIKDTSTEQVAAIASKSLANQVFVDYRVVRFIIFYFAIVGYGLKFIGADVFRFLNCMPGCFLSNIRRLGQTTGFSAHGCSPS